MAFLENVAMRGVSIHALLTECDFLVQLGDTSQYCFNPRTPYGVRQLLLCIPRPPSWFQSTHSLRSATEKHEVCCGFTEVSIHALLTECDEPWTPSPSSPALFQSTHSLRSATSGPLPPRRGRRCFNPRTPYGVRPGLENKAVGILMFQSTHSLRSATRLAHLCSKSLEVSIHALLTECDWNVLNPRRKANVRFQSTHSLRSATINSFLGFLLLIVSIHALLTECDQRRHPPVPASSCFNPRTPYGVRPPPSMNSFTELLFQSTHSLRSATAADLIHCYSTEQIILCANLPKKTVIARLHFLSIYLSIFYSQCITPIADLPGNSCELEVDAQAMFNSL